MPESEMTPFYEDYAHQAFEWMTANLKERILILRVLIRFEERQIRPQDFLQLLSSVNLGKIPVVAELEEMHSSVLHLHSSLLLNLMQNFPLQW